MDAVPHLCTVEHAAAIALVSRKTIYNWMKAGLIGYVVLPSGVRRIVIDTLFRSPESAPVRHVGFPARPVRVVPPCSTDPLRLAHAREQLRQRRPPRLRMAKMRGPA